MDVVINPVGGLANRMRAIASGIALCNSMHLNLKEIDWPINSDLYCPFDELFEPIPNIPINNISNKRQLLLFDEPRKKNLFLSKLIQINRYSSKIIDNSPDIEGYFLNRKEAKRPILIQSGLVFYDFSTDLYRSLFKPREELLDLVKKTVKDFSNMIGLHIRRTDNTLSIEKSPLILFERTIENELLKDSSTKFYLATDCDYTKWQLVNKYGQNIINCSSKSAIRTTKNGIKEALIELIILSQCRKIYGSYWSSFSEAAAILGNTTLETISKVK
ncbi:MAG: hypothetical protein NC301_02715 [Bacteroides sp.]|nr:hypothetical protein [Bacteroides sp.]MCM1379644.1 hypothetical protein [Bacteroides sp.]MCM1445974.1 hypothetical protein [Prevotella sp.]